LERKGKLRHPLKGHVLYLTRGSNVNGPTVVFSNITRGGQVYSQEEQEMLLVPFQEGRLLQFEGDLLHAVPRPADLWIHPVLEEPIHDPPSQYGRSVVLFNLWKEPPKGLEYSENDKVMSATHDNTTPLCNPKSQWRQAPIVTDWEGSLWDHLWKPRFQFQLPLMGNTVRRGTNDLTLQLEATDLVEQAIMSSHEDTRPKRVYLQIPNDKRRVQSTTQEL